DASGVAGRSPWSAIVTATTTGQANQAPTVSIAAVSPITLPASASLVGSSSEAHRGGTVTVAWTTVSGPGTVTFASATSASTTASFSAAGSYSLKLTATDNHSASAFATVSVTVNAANSPPTVSIAPVSPITLPASASLVGS